MENWVKDILKEKKKLLELLIQEQYFERVEDAGNLLVSALQEGKKILLAGNGGSAADAQHFAGEIVGRFTMERPSLPAISLCVDPSVTTCIGNDYGYEHIFDRQIAGLGNPGDVLIAISTSGNSANTIQAAEVAHKKNISVIGYLGKDGGKMKDVCDIPLIVPSHDTPRIQEVHTLTTHVLCEMIEKRMFK